MMASTSGSRFTNSYRPSISNNDPGSRSVIHRKVRCFNCNEEGHTVNTCQKPARPRGSCFNCGQMGHRIRDCPKNKDNMKPDSTTHVIDCLGVRPFTVNISFKVMYGNDTCEFSLKALLDTGSPISLIKHKFVPPEKIVSKSYEGKFQGINGSQLNILGIFETDIVVDNEVNTTIQFFVVSDSTMSYSSILGRDFISQNNVVINSDDFKINCHHNVHDSVNDDLNFVQELMNIEYVDQPTTVTENLNVNPNLPLKIQEEISQIYCENYVLNNKPDKPQISFEMNLQLTKHEIFSCKPRRLSFYEKNELDKILLDLLQRNIIKESDSPYCSPIVLTRKKTGELRMCVDYRILNKYLVRDKFPIPLIDDHLECLREKQYFTKIVLKNAFFHVPLCKDSTKYTSFITPSGQFEFLRMPFGLSSGPATFA